MIITLLMWALILIVMAAVLGIAMALFNPIKTLIIVAVTVLIYKFCRTRLD